MIVGIGSNARVGKDTSALALCRDLGFRRIGFADPLRDLAFGADPMIISNSSVNVGIGHGHLAWLVQSVGGWDQAKTQFPEVRRFLQNLGAAARNTFGETFWIDQALSRVRGDEKVVIPDVRYLNEFDAIKARGGFLIKINRPGFVGVGHPSETELSDPSLPWDAVVDNGGTVLELEAKVVGLVRGWLKNTPAPSEKEGES